MKRLASILIAMDGACEAPPRVTTVFSDAGTKKITQITGSTDLIHFVTPKGSGDVTLTATLSPSSPAILSDITWEGATESGTDARIATLSRSSASKNVVKIKYKGSTIKEMRVWVVWAAISSNTGSNTFYNNAGIGNPQQSGWYVITDISFTFAVQPTTIITDSNRPNLSGNKTTSPPGGTHPFFGGALSNGADLKWDSSRQMRVHILNPGNIPAADQAQPAFFDIANYPSNPVEGNDDQGVVDPECNNPYQQVTGCSNSQGTLTGKDNPKYGIRHSAGTNGDTFELRMHFKEFVRLEIEGDWTIISDAYPWKAEIKCIKQNGQWADNGTAISLNNNNF